MRVIINGEAREVNCGTLQAALAELGYGSAVVATAVNGTFVSAGARAQQNLNDNDEIEILAPMQGG